MDYQINFPNLHIYLQHVGKNVNIGGFTIAYYGIVIALGMLAGLAIASWKAKKTGQNPDTYFDLALIAIICSLIGARLYYVIFRWDLYKGNLLSIINIRQGGLAIYGGVIAAIFTTLAFSKVRKIPYGRLCDTGVLGLILGQIIGRWGNFFNREAFGGYTNGLLSMQIPVSAVRTEDLTEEMLSHASVIDGVTFVQVHPTFLYESLWNLALLALLLLFFKKRSFEGEVTLWYLLGYGIGRFWIESLRTDQLLLPGIGYPVSKVVAVIMAAAALVWIAVGRKRAAARGGKGTEDVRYRETHETN